MLRVLVIRRIWNGQLRIPRIGERTAFFDSAGSTRAPAEPVRGDIGDHSGDYQHDDDARRGVRARLLGGGVLVRKRRLWALCALLGFFCRKTVNRYAPLGI